jgi:hypothetical protein
MKIQKNTYHIVLEWPTLWLYGSLPYDLIVLIDHLIVVTGVQ